MTYDRTPRRPLLVVLISLCMLAASCSGSSTTTISEDAASGQRTPSTQQDEPTAIPAPTSEPEPTSEPTVAPEPTATPEPQQVYWGSEIQVGDCINRLPDNPDFEPPNIVSCDELHEEEIYGVGEIDAGPDEPYPDVDGLAERVSVELCHDATLEFGGATWEQLPMLTFVQWPSEAEWDAGDRFIMCSAASSNEGELKIGTAAGGTIDTDDVLLARSGLARADVDFDDWTVFVEHTTIDTLGSLTDAQFDLPLRRPFLVPQGFIFNAKPAGDEGHATSTWGYNWETHEFTDLGSILPGQELASTMAVDGDIIFAARATPDDDWDIWTTASGDATVLLGGDGNQQYPTLTPDQTQIVYQDNGDIWVANIDGSDPLQLTSGAANDYESAVSPDGSTVVFASDRTGNDDLWAVDITGGEPVNLTNHPGDESWPLFSDDGQYIYFTSDRLAPENDRSVLMVMNTDGTNQSWFGASSGSHAVVIPAAVADEVVRTAPNLNERYNYDLIEGAAGTTATWTHSSDRLSADLPAGWRVAEVNERIGFIAGPKPDAYFDIWEIDGVSVNLWEDEDADEFFVHYEDATAVQSCDALDGTDGIIPFDDIILGINGNFSCGDGVVAGVLAMYNTDARIGVVLESQRDNLPDADTDTAMLTEIAVSLAWG